MRIDIFALLILLIAASLSFLLPSSQHIVYYQNPLLYQSWKRQFHLNLPEQEDHFRLQIFYSNLHKIYSHNSQPGQSYLLGINQFIHLSEAEFTEIFLSKLLTNYNRPLQKNIQSQINLSFIKLSNFTDIDWQSLGKISLVKSQGNCNAGYAFSTTSLIESSLMMENQDFILSQQQIIDCAIDYETLGCQGGSRQGALKYSLQKGLMAQKQYPYTGTKGACKAQKGKYLPDFTIIQANGCDAIKQALYKSPITVAVNAKNWQLYSSGIFNNCASTSEVNHETLLVGVTQNYWKVKNSWGSRWGQGGYIRIKLGNYCGICERPGFGFSL